MKGFITYSTYRILNNQPCVILYGRLENNDSFITINEFQPYFFIETKNQKKASKLIDHKIKETNLKNFEGEKMSKIFIDLPKEVSSTKSELESEGIKTYESDINFSTKFLIDNNLQGAIEIDGDYDLTHETIDRVYKNPDLKQIDYVPKNLKVFSFDIETDRNAKNIYCISAYSKNYKKSFIITNEKVKNAISCESEKDLLQEFQEEIIKFDPDIITGWNVIDFDLKLLKEKFTKYKIPFILGRDNSPSKLRIESNFFRTSKANITGRVVLDGLDLTKTSFIKLENYKLDTAAKQLLGKGKLIEKLGSEKSQEIDRLYKKDKEALIEYNLLDAELAYKIIYEADLLDLTIQRSLLTGMSLDRVNSSIASLDFLYLQRARKNNLVCPSNIPGDREARIKGGHVMESKPGIYDNIIVLDFKSLYPSIIKTFNIDPSKYHEKKQKGDVESPNKAHFGKEEGILPNIIKDLWAAREKSRKEKNELGRYSTKILMNCFSDDTQIWTKEGIKNIKEVKKGELVYSYNPNKKILELHPITKTFKYKYNGDLIKIKTNHVDYLVTPNHKFLLYDKNKKLYWTDAEEMESKLIKGWIPKKPKINGEVPKYFNIQDKCDELKIKYKVKEGKLQKGPKHSTIPKKVNMKDWLSFLGWYIAEGHIYISKPKRYPGKVSWRGITHSITITQYSKKNKNKIKKVFDNLGIKYSFQKKEITISNQLIAEILLKEIGQGSGIKRIPKWVYKLDPKLLKHIYYSLINGDGDKDFRRYSTKNPKLAEDFLRLLYHQGISGFIYKDYNPKLIYRVQINIKRGVQPYLSKYKNFSREKYNGNVYCVEVKPHHTIVAGRKNRLNITGQSFFGVLANPSCRFYNINIANSITHFGQELIKLTAKKAEEQGYDVIYSDTDSIFINTKTDSKEKSDKIGKKLEKDINNFYGDYIKEKYERKSFLELEYEKCYLRFLMPKLRGSSAGAKKRYAGLLENDKIEFVGLETVRSDWTTAAKEFQKELLDRIFHKKEVKNFIKKYVDDILAGKKDKDLIYRKSLRKEVEKYTKMTPPHVKAAKKLKKIESSIIEYVITTAGPEPIQNKSHQIDYDHYVKKQIKPIADTILSFFNTTFEEVIGGTKQTSLFNFE